MLLDATYQLRAQRQQSAVRYGAADGDYVDQSKHRSPVPVAQSSNPLAGGIPCLEAGFGDHYGSTDYNSHMVFSGRGYSVVHAPKLPFGDQQSDPKRRIQVQNNYLDTLAFSLPTPESLRSEHEVKEAFRVHLSSIAQEAVATHAEICGLPLTPNAVDFKCFGSLRNGFALPGADLNLVMTTRGSHFPNELESECPRILEKAFLDAGFGARLILTSRVPILKLCENPSGELLGTLKANRKAWEETQGARTAYNSGPEARYLQNTSAMDCHSWEGARPVVFPKSGVGIQCDIIFSGQLALHNSELLRCYAMCDDRVRVVGLFVKKWAKARKINDPFRGTLCSYGYILMVIHYLINVVRPPLVPNLQINYRPRHHGQSHREVTTVEGCDIRFFNDEGEIKTRTKANARGENNQSVGSLLRGFFAYYGGRGRQTPLGEFNWCREVISIRTRGGILSKAEKGWTGARVDGKGNKHRFLIAIEDPFELDHNIGRTVILDGSRAIQNEFQRAHMIINRVQEIPGARWVWRTDEGHVGEYFFEEAKDRLQPRHDLRALHSNPNPNSSKNISRSALVLATITEAGQNNTVGEPPPPFNTNKSKFRRRTIHPVDNLSMTLSKQPPTGKDTAVEQLSHLAGPALQGNALSVEMTTACQKRPQLDKAAIGNRKHNNHTIYPAIGRQLEMNKITTQNAHSGTTSFTFHEEAIHERSASRSGPHQQLQRDAMSHLRKTSSYQLNPLIRPPVPKATRKREENDQRFRQQAAVCAKAMRRMLHISEPVEASCSRSMTSCSPKHCEESQLREKSNQVPMTAVDYRTLSVDPMQIHAIHKRTSQQVNTASSDPYPDYDGQSILDSFSMDTNNSTENLKLFSVLPVGEIDLA